MLSLTELVTYEAFHFTAVSPRCSKEISIEYRHLNRDSAPVDQLNQLMREKRETKNFQREREEKKKKILTTVAFRCSSVYSSSVYI